MKGFTLIEMILTIALLGILALLIYPVVGDIIEKGRTQAYEESKQNMIDAATQYSIKNNLGDKGVILLDTLKQEGFLKNETYYNPITNEELTGCVAYVYNNSTNQYNYSYLETIEECNNW